AGVASSAGGVVGAAPGVAGAVVAGVSPAGAVGAGAAGGGVVSAATDSPSPIPLCPEAGPGSTSPPSGVSRWVNFVPSASVGAAAAGGLAAASVAGSAGVGFTNGSMVATVVLLRPIILLNASLFSQTP
ncbi:MAG: hypothetical protein E5V28_22280, partial [Mesorhizobium sp.]